MNKSELAIEAYKKAYYEHHGKYPRLTRKGSWVYINDSPTAHRVSDLYEFVENFERRKEEKDTPVNDYDPEDIRVLLALIRQRAKGIFRSKDIKEMQIEGKNIAKWAKRILNIMDENE